MDVKRFGSRRSTHTFSSISVLCRSSYGAVFTNLASLQSNVTAVFAHEPCLQPHIPPGSCVRLRLLCGKNEGTPPNLYFRFCQYSPTSPAYSPTSPAYSPTSPQVSSLLVAFALSMTVSQFDMRHRRSIPRRRRTRIDLLVRDIISVITVILVSFFL
jgi:RNA polymerase Rpb1 C-terminal repeat